MTLHQSTEWASNERSDSTKQPTDLRRLYRTMQLRFDVALAVIRPLILAAVAGLLILVVLPAAIAAQAAANR
jgi:hypothetical protein